MFSEINAKLMVFQGELRKATKYNMQLVDYQEELEKLKERIAQLQDDFEIEQEDVKRLERFGLTYLFATLSGTRDEKLSKERQELITAEHALVEAEKVKEDIEQAIIILQEKLQAVKFSKQEYQQLLKQKEILIKESISPFAATLFELAEQESILQANIAELQEAITAGQRVKENLDMALTSLDKAASWGQWDMFGGGTISGMIKHQHIDDAEEDLYEARKSMRLFQKELLDVKIDLNQDIHISDMLRFADFFFDGFIADYMVQTKINDMIDQTESHYDKVSDVLAMLKGKFAEEMKKLDSIQKEKLEIVEKC
ncbi:hypothetical protein A8F94_09295 [Bacillus sp. FJAT-27225]|uniref:hypothetical protein n=1 Tax=Bacillus sp. FJAT-27225 TaxID=1743144 RepID=UPI00080C3052|nr:hypothetical protein [Bacillus sp. FJAT-27225]OCA88011.1 hypothetical protein A8F94_09295 [Bacillus sp. FJAT-27225]